MPGTGLFVSLWVLGAHIPPNGIIVSFPTKSPPVKKLTCRKGGERSAVITKDELKNHRHLQDAVARKEPQKHNF